MLGIKTQFVVLVSALVVSAQAFASAEFKAGEVIVKYKEGALRSRSTMNMLYQGIGARHVNRFGGVMKGMEQIQLNDGIKVQDAIAGLLKDPAVEYAQPNYILHILPVSQRIAKVRPTDGNGIPCIPGFDIPGCDPNAKLPCLIPGVQFPPGCDSSGGGSPTPPGGNPQPPTSRPVVGEIPKDVEPPVADPELAKAYGMSKIHATDVWASHRGSKEFIVADIDTGIDYNHEDLAFNIWRNPKPTQNDVIGFDFIHNDGLPFDDNMHGTHTAGTIGAVGGNGIGVSGVAQRVSLMSLKFLTGEGSGTTADAIKAIDYAIEHGAKVLSNSWGGKGDDGNAALKDAITRAAAKDVLFVAAAGNDGADNDDPANASYPAAFDNDNLISVAATDQSDQMPFFSNYGAKTTHVAAPGVGVYSTIPGNKYQAEDGTSMACPHVAGAAALIWSMKSSLTYKQVKDLLIKNVDVLPALQGKTVSGGRINVQKAMAALKRL